jgi:hypothetical protein
MGAAQRCTVSTGGSDGQHPPPRPQQSLAEHMAMTRSDRVVQTRGETVADVVDMLHELCAKMDGKMSALHTVHRPSIRCGC